MSELSNFGGYRKSRELFENVANDMMPLATNPLCTRMVSQQMASADSICSNIEEGYGRQSSREYRQYLVIARGSARETQGRYERFGRWLAPQVASQRTALCEEIIRILTATINRLDTR